MSDNAGERKADTVSLADEDAVRQVLVSSVLGLWDIVNNLTRLRPSRRERYRVTIFGSARIRRARSVTRKRSGWRRRWPGWAATSSPVAARD